MNQLSALTPREREVLELIFLGMTNREIAQELVISKKTVETHTHHIYEKLGVSSRNEAILPLLGEILAEATAAVLKCEGFIIENDDDQHDGRAENHDDGHDHGDERPKIKEFPDDENSDRSV